MVAGADSDGNGQGKAFTYLLAYRSIFGISLPTKLFILTLNRRVTGYRQSLNINMLINSYPTVQ
jgi:hypothetical protein